jgi:tetratricopeptide (TPR) repeat protein
MCTKTVLFHRPIPTSFINNNISLIILEEAFCMSFNTNISDSPSRPETGKLALAVSCVRQGRNAQAFLLLSGPGFEKAPAAQFALGLCYLHAEELSKAIACFEQTLHLLKASSAPSRELQAAKETYVKLAAKQIEAKAYLEPMDADFFAGFPQAAEQNTLLALIHAYRGNGMIEQARRLAAGLTGAEFEEYKKTL